MDSILPSEVKSILLDTELTDLDIQGYIQTAHIFLTEVFTGLKMSGDKFKEIERWFTAHLIAITKERTAIVEKVDVAEITYTGKWGDELSSTSYGQTVLLLDTSGRISNMGKRQVKITVVKSF